MDTQVGRRVRQARLEAGLDQDALAGLVGVSSKTIRSWEKEVSHPTPANFAQLAVVLGKPVFWFYNNDDGDDQDLKIRLTRVEERLTELERKMNEREDADRQGS